MIIYNSSILDDKSKQSQTWLIFIYFINLIIALIHIYLVHGVEPYGNKPSSSLQYKVIMNELSLLSESYGLEK